MSIHVTNDVRVSSEWTRRLANAKAAAQHGNEGDEFFLQASKTPLVSCFITTGKKKCYKKMREM